MFRLNISVGVLSFLVSLLSFGLLFLYVFLYRLLLFVMMLVISEFRAKSIAKRKEFLCFGFHLHRGFFGGDGSPNCLISSEMSAY